MTGTLLAALGTTSMSAQADKHKSSDKITVVKCLGIAKAGHNDCGSTDGRHTCSGKATKNLDPTEWAYLPDGPLCEDLGGKKMVKKGKIVKKQKPKKDFLAVK